MFWVFVPWAVLLGTSYALWVVVQRLPSLPLPKPLLLPAIVIPSLVLLSLLDGYRLETIAFSTRGVAVPTLFPNFGGYLFLGTLLAVLAQIVVGQRRGILFTVGVAGVLALAVGVPLVSIASTRQAAAELARDDHSEAGQSRPTTIEFTLPMLDFARPDPLRNAPCEAVCQRLLLGREVEWVRVTGVDWYTNRPPTHGASAVYRLRAGASCLEAVVDSEPVLPGPLEVRSPGICMVPIQGSAELRRPAEARVSVKMSADSGSVAKRHKPDPSFLRQTRAEAVLVEPGTRPRTVAVRTEVITRPLSLPLRRAAAASGLPHRAALSRYNLEVARSEQVFQPVDLADVLRGAFGYRIAAPAGGS